MDELLEIERSIGEVIGVASLQYGGEEPSTINKEDIEWEVFPEIIVVEKPKQYDEEGNEIIEEPPAPLDDEEANKPPPFNPREFDWTITNRKPRNLPQLFLQMKGKNGLNDVRQAEDYSTIQYDAIAQGLDAYIKAQTRGDYFKEEKKFYLQLIFRNNN